MAFDGFPLSPYGGNLCAYEWDQINLEYVESAEILRCQFFFSFYNHIHNTCVSVMKSVLIVNVI